MCHLPQYYQNVLDHIPEALRNQLHDQLQASKQGPSLWRFFNLSTLPLCFGAFSAQSQHMGMPPGQSDVLNLPQSMWSLCGSPLLLVQFHVRCPVSQSLGPYGMEPGHNINRVWIKAMSSKHNLMQCSDLQFVIIAMTAQIASKPRVKNKSHGYSPMAPSCFTAANACTNSEFGHLSPVGLQG